MSSPADVLAAKIKKAQEARKERWRMQMSQMMTTSVQMILHERKETLDAPDMAEEESEPVALEHTDSGRSSPVERVDTQRLQREIDRRRADSAQGAQASDPMGLMVGLDELVAEGHEPIFMDRLHGVAAVQRFRTAFAAVTRLLESSSSPLRLRFDERHSPPLRPSSRGAQSGDVSPVRPGSNAGPISTSGPKDGHPTITSPAAQGRSAPSSPAARWRPSSPTQSPSYFARASSNSSPLMPILRKSRGNQQEITAPESDPARMEGSLHEDTHRAWLDEQLGESLLPRGALPLSEQDPAWPQQVQEMASLRHSGGSPPVRPRSPAAAAQSHPTDGDDRLGPAAQEEAASAASPGRVPETTGEDRREPLPEGAAQGQRAETDAEDSAAAGAAAGDGAKSGAGLGRLAQAVATLRRAKTKLAIGDLSSWRLNQEVSDMIAEACRGIEAAESEAQGGVEAGTRSVAAAVPRREAELEKAKLKVRLAKALADKESAEAALREERAGHAQHLSALEALDEQPSTEAAKVAKAARGELSVEAQWQFTIASLSRALALRPTASGIAGESPRQHPETAPKSPPRPGAADGSTPERGAVDLAASALALQAQVTALTVELSKTQRGLEAERRRAGEHERALKQLREEKSATREHARILRLEKEGKELSEQLAFRNAQEVAAQNRIRALTGEVESLKRGLAARSGRDKESAAGREVLQARASLEAAHKDLERAHGECLRLREAGDQHLAASKAAQADCEAAKARAAALGSELRHLRAASKEQAAALQAALDAQTNKTLEVQERCTELHRRLKHLRRGAGETERERANLQRELVAAAAPAKAQETRALSHEVFVLREQHRDALLLLGKYEHVIRVLGERAGLPTGAAGLPSNLAEVMQAPEEEAEASERPAAGAGTTGHDAEGAGAGAGVLEPPPGRVVDVEGHLLFQDPPLGAAFSADRALAASDDDATGSFWLLPDATPGAFVIDLGAPRVVTGFRFRNTRNNGWRNRGTRHFTIAVTSLYPEVDSPDWEEVLRDALPNAWASERAAEEPLPVVTRDVLPVRARYVRFSALSWWGLGAGLNHLQVRGIAVGAEAVAAELRSLKRELGAATASAQHLPSAGEAGASARACRDAGGPSQVA